MEVAAIVTMSVQQFRGLAADSREVKPGFLFAALSGSKTDGARFIEDAVKRGAIAVLAPGGGCGKKLGRALHRRRQPQVAWPSWPNSGAAQPFGDCGGDRHQRQDIRRSFLRRSGRFRGAAAA